jgi:hypothetical protein
MNTGEKERVDEQRVRTYALHLCSHSDLKVSFREVRERNHMEETWRRIREKISSLPPGIL